MFIEKMYMFSIIETNAAWPRSPTCNFEITFFFWGGGRPEGGSIRCHSQFYEAPSRSTELKIIRQSVEIQEHGAASSSATFVPCCPPYVSSTYNLARCCFHRLYLSLPFDVSPSMCLHLYAFPSLSLPYQRFFLTIIWRWIFHHHNSDPWSLEPKFQRLFSFKQLPTSRSEPL